MKKFFLLSTFLTLSLEAQEWINPSNKNVKTVFYQGMNNSQVQGAKYTGSHGFISPTTGEHVVCKKAIDIVKDIWVKPEIDEVIPAPIKRDWLALLLQPKNLVYNIWQRSHEFIFTIANKMSGIEVKNHASSTPAQTIACHSLAISKINIAQEGDLANHRKRFDALRKEHPDAYVILMGVSRGAATTSQSAALLNKENPDQLKNTKLIHLEGCFDSVVNTTRSRHPWIFKSEYVFNGLEKPTSFKRKGPAPIQSVDDFPKHIPVAFITSIKDREVPAVRTKELVEKLVLNGHKEVYLLELKNSSHPRYMMDDEKDASDYQHFMHALYKKYNLPYIPEYAQQGEALIAIAKRNAESLVRATN